MYLETATTDNPCPTSNKAMYSFNKKWDGIKKKKSSIMIYDQKNQVIIQTKHRINSYAQLHTLKSYDLKV